MRDTARIRVRNRGRVDVGLTYADRPFIEVWTGDGDASIVYLTEASIRRIMTALARVSSTPESLKLYAILRCYV